MQVIKGISTINPWDMEKEYLEKTVDYTIEKGYQHYQLIGPIHNPVRGNIDGMTFSKKYAQFNDEKDAEYVELNLDIVNAALDRLHAAGVKSYMWHHELDLPFGFTKAFPEVLNENGDVEVSHPLVKDYLQHKIYDFFAAYPKMDGIILTLHETKVPLLKLKNQKLGKIERVKYVTEILFRTCEELGKELVVRPFASLPEDYDMMLQAYESISRNLIVMDKWTQFDWSLTLPHNAFFKKIKNNPLLVETDIFGEYFGKGRLPVMLKKHIEDKYAYCQSFSPIGYVNRIDRDHKHPFGTVNEVNLEIMLALMEGRSAEEAIDAFFKREYPEVAEELKEIMAPTEDLNRKLLNNKNYYFMQGSFFPELNHSKNHFYFEMMQKECNVASNEWFIPVGWKRGELQEIFDEKEEVLQTATALLEKVKGLKGKVEEKRYASLLTQFENLYYAARAWRLLLDVFYNYVRYFETKDEGFEKVFYEAVEKLLACDKEGREVVGDNDEYYLNQYMFNSGKITYIVQMFAEEVKASFATEKADYFALQEKGYTDFVLCGGAMESHKLQKEVNFSDTMLVEGGLCRIPGNRRGAQWSQINGHGWFSYEVKVKPNAKNTFLLEMGSLTEYLDVKLTIGEETYEVREGAPKQGKKQFAFTYAEKEGEDKVRIRIDRLSPYTPLVYSICVK